MEELPWASTQGSPKTLKADTGVCGDTQRAGEAVHTDTGEVEHTVAQGTVLMLPEVGDLHLWGHGQP